ncbi:hypothetical protein KKE54_03520 [bacterium]|jgi:tRNA uridine 5-carbamoylmethylation protein Kti12|nr:hypothetical protein [bacterium]
MTNVKDLIDLLKNDVIPEIEDVIDGLFELINDSKTATADVKQELEELQELKTDFKVMLEEAESGEIDEEEAGEIIAEIDEMRSEGEEE